MEDAAPKLSTRPERFSDAQVPLSTAWLLAECMQFRGKQDLWTRQKPELLEALREQAIIQSVESSNRIEGVTVEPARLRPIVLHRAKPKDRSEEELSGYRRALDWIFTRRRPVAFNVKTILHLHALCQQGAGDAGKLKSRDNEIVEFTASGERRVRFRPTSAACTRQALGELCASYESLSATPGTPSLLLIATTVFDLLCIHPFRDGNGRVSRLVTALLLQQNGFVVGQFVSLERLIEQSKEDYYRVLYQCSQRWESGENLIVPWWNYFLTTLRRAYAEFADEVERNGGRLGKSQLVRQAALAMVGPFTLAELQAQVPSASTPLVKKVLLELKSEHKVKLTGRGRGAAWETV
jgi:Fic family protein